MLMAGKLDKSKVSWSAARNLQLAVDLRSVADILKDHDVNFLAFKGPVLAFLAYPHLDRDPSYDLDILVRKHDLPRALEALGTLGYAPKSAAWRTDLPGMNEVALQASDRTEVDLHWRLSPIYFVQFDLKGAFHRRRTVRVAGREIDTLSNEDCLLGLAIHHARHGWPDASWVQDLVGLVTHQPIDWELVHILGREARAQRVVAVALLLVDSAQPGLLPAHITRAAMQTRGAVSLAVVLRQAFGRHVDSPASVRGVWHHLQMLDGTRDRIRYISRRLLLPNHRDIEGLPTDNVAVRSLYARRIRRLVCRSFAGLSRGTA